MLDRRTLVAIRAARPGWPAAPSPRRDKANGMVITTKDGKITIKLRPDLAPKHVAQIKKLVSEKFYDGIVFHRVIDGFMAQTGDPTGTGTGGSKLPNIPAEFTSTPFKRGTRRHGALRLARQREFAVLHLPGGLAVPRQQIHGDRRGRRPAWMSSTRSRRARRPTTAP